MASFTERIAVVIDVTTQKASAGLKDFRTQVGQAEGFVGKLKAGAGSLSSTLAGAGPGALAGAATAAGAAAFKMASDFSDLGVEVGKFSDATGLSAEQASRWIEVADDLGIGADGLQGILGKLNKNIDPKLFADYGIEIAKAADGTVDANQTFLNTLDVLNRIKDPAERARTAAKLLGKGWQDAAELIGMSSADVKKRLEGVGKAKVFDEGKVAKARDFRDAMDNLNDAMQEVALTIGEKVAPALSDLASSVDNIGPVIDMSVSQGLKPLDDLNAALGGIGDAWEWAFGSSSPAEKAIMSYDAQAQYARQAAEYVDGLTDATKDLASANQSYLPKAHKVLDVEKDINETRRDLIGQTLDMEQAQLDLTEAMQDAYDTDKDTTASTTDKARATLNAKQQVHDYITLLGDIPAETETMILTAIDKGDYETAANMLAMLTTARTVPIGIQVSGATVPLAGGNSPSGVVPTGQRVPVPTDPLTTQDRTTINVYPRTMPTQRELIDMNRNTARRQGTTGN